MLFLQDFILVIFSYYPFEMFSNGENPPKRQCTFDVSKISERALTPRSYQIEILETAKRENTIACLGTGTGKTFIAVMLIREFADDVRLSFEGRGKRIFFLVPTVPLVHQQAGTISDHTDLKVKKLFGDLNVDSWDKDKWTDQFVKSEVFVMTAEIFRIIVDHAFIPLNKIRLIIFDECHRAQGEHPYCQAMKCFTNLDPREMPRIFGLSASLINGKCKPTQLEKHLADLEKTLSSSITTASDVIDLQKYGADPDECLVCYKPFETDYFKDTALLSRLTDMKLVIESHKHSDACLGRNSANVSECDLEFFDKPSRCLNAIELILKTLGSWCAVKAAEIFKEEVSSVLDKQVLYKVGEKELLTQLSKFLDDFMEECQKCNFQFTADNTKTWPHKLFRLSEIFLAAKKSKKFLKLNSATNVVSFDDDPEKYHQMLKIKERKDASEIQICSIIFVQQRITAYVLQQWILELKKVFPELSFLNPEYIVGHGSTGVKQTSMSEKQQKSVLRDFREKKCNVLISTCVLEEGMDVQQCNLVIRFDLPADFRGYVQSKGRARAKDSIYVLMSEVGQKYSQFCLDLCNFKTVERMLLNKCHNRSMPSEEEIREHMNDSLIPPYMPYGERGARITLASAISLINRYCASLPSDMATKLTAKWNIRVVDPDNPRVEYECTLKMPINSPLKQPIVGEKMQRKKLAKMAAALKACEKLDEIGELNEHLVPISALLQQKIDEELGILEKEDGNGAIPGTKRRRQSYKKHIPVFLQNCGPRAFCCSYLYILNMDLIEPLPGVLNPRNRPIKNPAHSPRGLGILLSKKLPKVNSFPLFTKIGKIAVTVTPCDETFELSRDELEAVENFHKFVFSDPLRLDKNKTFSPTCSEFSFYVVPINAENASSPIDWQFMSEVKNHPYHVLKRKKSVASIPYDETLYRDAVLLKIYKMPPPSYHHVIRISDMTPNSACDFSDNRLTFKDYYKAKYGFDIRDERQPLVETVTNPATVYWKPLHVSVKEIFADSDSLSKTKQRHKNYHEFLVPELSIVHPFPSMFFFKVQVLPTVLFRLQSLLLAEELRQSVASLGLVGKVEFPEDFRWPYFNLETSDKELKKALRSLGQNIPEYDIFIPEDIVKRDKKIESFEREVNLEDHPGPNPSLLLQALTSKSAGDEFDLERLEMIGDSFLKYVVSVKTYLKYPLFDEGKLTKIRSVLIQNLHLYQQAKKKNLGEFLICSAFSSETNWLPPCYTVDEEIDARVLDNRTKPEELSKLKHNFFTQQIVSDKCIADAVEALIGAYLLSCGQRGALMFMHWMGLDPFPVKKDRVTKRDFFTWPPEPPSVIVGEVPDVEDCLRRLTEGFYRFERKINYTFKDKALLLQAFTHPSYYCNEITDCYQRLEFLGDAILDFLITRQLYEDPNDHSPGKLTDLRSALVNNIFFASLAVKYEYHKHLKMMSAELFGLMKHFLEIFEQSDQFAFLKEHGYLEEIECFELDEVEVPKALGDIFESVAGAIYLDSGMSLDTVWKVYYPMIAPALWHVSKHVPKSPVRELYEVLKTKNVFSQAVTKEKKLSLDKGEKTYILVKLPNGKEVEGVGSNKKVAKRSAAKRALAELRKEQNAQ